MSCGQNLLSDRYASFRTATKQIIITTEHQDLKNNKIQPIAFQYQHTYFIINYNQIGAP